MRCIFSPLAKADFETITDYISADNPQRALSFIRDLRERCGKLTTFPAGATLRPDLGEGVRVIPYKRYLIFYVVLTDAIRIERVIHSSRDITDETYDEL
jgi:toxin ParE1/3/4